MVHVCVVPGCSNHSNRDKQLSFYCLPLKNKSLLKTWIHKIGRKNFPLNTNSRVCSAHFVGSTGRCLRPDEYPTMNLPVLTTPIRKRKSPKQRKLLFTDTDVSDERASPLVELQQEESAVQTDITYRDIQSILTRTNHLETRVLQLEQQLNSQLFRLSNIADDPQKILFYTGFPDYASLRACFDYLGPAVNKLNYWGSVSSTDGKKSTGRTRSLPPLEEFFFSASQTSTWSF